MVPIAVRTEQVVQAVFVLLRIVPSDKSLFIRIQQHSHAAVLSEILFAPVQAEIIRVPLTEMFAVVFVRMKTEVLVNTAFVPKTAVRPGMCGGT